MRRSVLQRWRAWRQSDRFDWYTRLTLALVCAAQPVLFVVIVRPFRSWAGWLLVAAVIAYAVVCVRLVDAALDHHLRHRDRPDVLTAVVGVAALAGAAAATMLLDGYTARLLGILSWLVPGLAGVSIALSRRALWVTLALLTMAGGVVSAWLAPRPVPTFAAIVAALAAVVLTFRTSAWMLALLWELDRARESQAELAVAQERLRFARDLHDVVGRQLSVVAVKSELAAQLAHRDAARAAGEMRDVRTLAQQSLSELRELVRGYRTVDLETELMGARSVLNAAGIQCRVIGSGSGLPEPVMSVLAWVVREGVTNVLRHSDAEFCIISLQRADGAVTLSMENDGARHRPAELTLSPGSGLLGLTERVAGVGGELNAGPTEPNGFRLCVVVPR